MIPQAFSICSRSRKNRKNTTAPFAVDTPFPGSKSDCSKTLHLLCSPKKRGRIYFLFLCFPAAALTVAKLIINNIGGNEKTKTDNMIKSNFGYILVMSISLFGTSFFQTLAAARIEAIILYPLLSALSLIAGSTMASLLFKEKLKKDCILGIALVLCALIFSKI